jgi:hypothetical protein
MWKWIVIALLAIIVLLGGTCYAGYRRVAGGGNVVQVAMAATQDRVFAALTHPDSLAVWMPPATMIASTGKGAFQPGDTIRIAPPSIAEDANRRNGEVWVVREVHAPTLLVVDGVQFDVLGYPSVLHTRYDSLVAIGDSTRVVSTFRQHARMRNASLDTGGPPPPAVLGMAEKLIVGSSRIRFESELRRLKTHVEKP